MKINSKNPGKQSKLTEAFEDAHDDSQIVRIEKLHEDGILYGLDGQLHLID